MNPFFKALSLFKRKQYEKCKEICTKELTKSAYDQAFWLLKMRCFTEQMYIDDIEAEEDGIVDNLLDDNAISQVARPGTSLRQIAHKLSNAAPPNSSVSSSSTSQSIRPVTQLGQPISGVLRPGSQGGRTGNLEQELRTPRTSRTSRPLTSSGGRSVRLGTASMLSTMDEQNFINLSRLNLNKYSQIIHLNKSLYEYILYVANDTRMALNFAAQCSEAVHFKSWWWKKELGKCYYKIGLLRDAEKQFKSSLNNPECSLDVYLWLGKLYLRMDQPLSALEVYKNGLIKYNTEPFLHCHAARVHEALNQFEQSSKYYREALQYEPINCEAIACIAMHYFYNDQPEIALRYYRRILQMGACNAEIYNNIGLCCYYAQQFDMVIICFERALLYSDSDELTADCWYNCGLVVLSTGDKQLASQCFKLALVANNSHAEAYNNLGVIEMMMTRNRGQISPSADNIQKSKTLFQSATFIGPHLYEPHYNLALIGEKLGQYDLCYNHVKQAISLYPGHYAATELFNRIKKLYEDV